MNQGTDSKLFTLHDASNSMEAVIHLLLTDSRKVNVPCFEHFGKVHSRNVWQDWRLTAHKVMPLKHVGLRYE